MVIHRYKVILTVGLRYLVPCVDPHRGSAHAQLPQGLGRSFRVAAPFVWNNLPRHVRNDGISREQFARDLKTVLSARAYSSEAPLRMSV